MAALESAKKLYDAWHAGDMLTALSLMSDDIVLHIWNPNAPGAKANVPMSGIWEGKTGVSRYFATLHESVEIARFDIMSFTGAGNDVFVKVYVEATVKSTGKMFMTDMIHNWTANDKGLFYRFVEYCDTEAVCKAHEED